MKRCPLCSQTYSDDMMFCLSDGTPLIAFYNETDAQTVIRPSPTAVPFRKGVSPVFKYLTFGISFLFLMFASAFTLIWLLGPTSETTDNNNNAKTVSNLSTPTPNPTVREELTPDLRSQQEALEKERERLAEELRKLQEQKSTPPDTPKTTPPFVDPPTARIKFRRGSIGEMVSGTIGSERSYVLRTLKGQYLSASIRSAGGCVVFTSGSTSTTYITTGGDNYLRLKNNCGESTKFGLTVNVR